VKRLLIISALSMALVACAGSPQTRATNSVAIACSTYAKALDKAADNKARLSPGQVETINKTNKVTDVICLPDSPIDPAAAVSVVQSAIKTVEEIVK
jgi:hypothetical protein